jgi:hypothetical protein
LYSITTNQAAIIALFRVINRYVGNLAPMTGVFPDFPAPVISNTDTGRELAMMRWGMPPPPRMGGPPVTNIRNTSSPRWRKHRSSFERMDEKSEFPPFATDPADRSRRTCGAATSPARIRVDPSWSCMATAPTPIERVSRRHKRWE